MHRRKNLLHKRAQTVNQKPKSYCGKDEVQKALFFSVPHCSQYHKKQAEQETVERPQESAGQHKVTTFDVSGQMAWTNHVRRVARLNAADEVGEGGVLDEPRQLTAVRSGHELHATLRYAARRQRLCLCADLILT